MSLFSFPLLRLLVFSVYRVEMQLVFLKACAWKIKQKLNWRRNTKKMRIEFRIFVSFACECEYVHERFFSSTFYFNRVNFAGLCLWLSHKLTVIARKLETETIVRTVYYVADAAWYKCRRYPHFVLSLLLCSWNSCFSILGRCFSHAQSDINSLRK